MFEHIKMHRRPKRKYVACGENEQVKCCIGFSIAEIWLKLGVVIKRNKMNGICNKLK